MTSLLRQRDDREMFGVSISVVTPTIGNPSIFRLIKELVPQLKDQDEWVLVGDGPQPDVKKAVKPYLRRNVMYHETAPDHFWGYPQRKYGLRVARGTHLWAIDDDDRVAPWALKTIRQAIAKNPRRPLVFRTIYYGIPIWRDGEPRLYVGNVSSQCFVVPNVRGRVGEYGERYEGDFDYITSTASLYPEGERALVWCPEVLTVLGIASAPDEYKKTVENWKWTR